MDEIRLITDSSSNENEKDSLKVVPLKISLEGHEYLDDDKLSLNKFLTQMTQSKTAGKTACPNIGEWLEALNGAQRAIIVTMTSGLSGTFASALQARDVYLEKHPDSQIIVIDSRSAGPEISIIIMGIKQMLKKEIRFVDLEEKIAQYRTKTHLLFVLQSLHNLSLNGRVSPGVAKIAGLLKINLVGTASKEGKLEPLTKTRGLKRALNEIIKQLEEMNYHGGPMIIDYCENKKEAEVLRNKILEKYPDSGIKIRPMKGLCSFYAEEGGLMIGFHE